MVWSMDVSRVAGEERKNLNRLILTAKRRSLCNTPSSFRYSVSERCGFLKNLRISLRRRPPLTP